PFLRHVKGFDDVPGGFPAIKEGTKRDGPIAIEPGLDELGRPGGPQPLFVGLDIDVDVIVDLRRDEDAFQAGGFVSDQLAAIGGGIDVALFYPMVPDAAGVASCP